MNVGVAPSQEKLVAALEARLRATSGACRRIDTHMSHLFLTPGRVYKLKRAITHAFADMAQLAQREAACRAELAINQRLAPSLYEGIAAVTSTKAGSFEIGGSGPPVDFLVVMRRFPDGALFSEMAAAGTLTDAHIDDALDRLIDLHRSQPPDFSHGGPDAFQTMLTNLRRTASTGDADPPAPMRRLFDALGSELSLRAPEIIARRTRGMVRRGHGDFHLQNICLFDGAVTPFDALEFDPALATTDVIYDAAFLFMDLQARDRGREANRAMNRFWDLADQEDQALALLPLFMALRACVRMAVAREAGRDAEATRYRELAERLLRRRSPRLVAIGGLSGSGKSSVARAIAAGLPGCAGARILSADILRKRAAGQPLHARLDASFYSDARRRAVYTRLVARAKEALEAGASVVADATFQSADSRADIEKAAAGHAFSGIWLELDGSRRAARVAARHGDVSDITAAAAAQQTSGGERGGWRCIDAGRPLPEVIADVARALAINSET